MPIKAKKIIKELGRDIFYDKLNVSNLSYDSATHIGSKLSDPIEVSYYECTIRYPHPIADQNGNNIRSFDFLIWQSEFFKTSYKSHPASKTEKPTDNNSGCYVATCVYGSYDCPQVWTLRRYRDNTLGVTWYGRAFIRTYYAISPTLVKWFGETKWFKKMWKGKLDRMVKKLQDGGIENTPYEDKDWK